MQGSLRSELACIKAFSETDFTEDLRRFDVPTLILHGDDDQIVADRRLGPHLLEDRQELDAEGLSRFVARHVHRREGPGQRRAPELPRGLGRGGDCDAQQHPPGRLRARRPEQAGEAMRILEAAPLKPELLRRMDATGGRPTTSRSARSTCSTTRCSGSRSGSATSRLGCSATGDDAGPELHLRPPEPDHQAARPGDDLRRRPRPRRPRHRRQRVPRGTYTEHYPDISRTRTG